MKISYAITVCNEHIEIDKLSENNADVKNLVETDDYKRTKLVTSDNALRGYN